MPTEEDRDNRIEGEPNAQPAPVQPQQIVFDTSGLDEKIAAGVREGLTRVAEQQRPQPVNPELVPMEISEDDDQDTRVAKRIHNEMIPIKQSLAQFQQFGLDRLADLTGSVVANAPDMPFWNRYNAEIRAEISRLPVEARSNRQALKLVHDTVAVRHIGELQSEAGEAAKRELLQPDPKGPIPGGSSRTVQTAPAPATLEDVFDEEQVDMITEKFGTADNFARTISQGKFGTFADYLKARAGLKGQKRAEGRPIIAFRKVELKKKGGEVLTDNK